MSDEPSNGPRLSLKGPRFAKPKPPGVRLWPLVIWVLIVGGVLTYVWFFQDVQRQNRVLATIATGMATALFGVFWLLFLSRIQFGLRLVLFGFLVIVGACVAALFKFESFSGDMIPQFSWRWKTRVEQSRVTEPKTRYFIADYPQFLGPNRDVILNGPTLDRDWTNNPPTQLWRRPVGEGWAGFAIQGTNAITLEQRDENEVVANYDLLTGEMIWELVYPGRYETAIGGIGPRSVPTIASNRVFSMGATGNLTCVDLASGELLWSTNVVVSNALDPESDDILPDWGATSSPLVVGDRVIVSAGGPEEKSLVAYSAESGEFVWGGGTNASSFSAPVQMTLSGEEQVLIFNEPNLSGHRLSDGKLLWEYAWGTGHPHVAVPKKVSENTLFVSSGYGVGAELVEVTRNQNDEWAAERVWKSIRMKAKFNNVARIGNFIYGLDDGIMSCLDLDDGSRMWKEGRYGHGQLMVVGDLMLITTEKGDVVLFEPVPEEPRELARITVFDHKQWNPPALAGQLLIVRTDREAACYVLPIAETPQEELTGEELTQE